jgi:hypothetical protein
MGNVQLKIQCSFRECDDTIVDQTDAVLRHARDELFQLIEASGASFSIHKEIDEQRADSTATTSEADGVVHLTTEETSTLLNVLKIAQTLLEQHTRPHEAPVNGVRTLDAQTLFEHDQNFLPLLISMRQAIEYKISV